MNNKKPTGITIDLKKVLLKIISYWWLFAICLALAFGTGYFYLKYATPLYSAQAKVLVKQSGAGSSFSASAILSEGLGVEATSQELSDVIEVFRSRPIVTRALEAIQGNIIYHKLGGYSDQPIDRGLPITLESYELAQGLERVKIYLYIVSADQFELRTEPEVPGPVLSFGTLFENELGRFKITKSSYPSVAEGEIYQIGIVPVSAMVGYFQRSVEIEILGSRGSSILRFTMKDPLPRRLEDFITALIESYNQAEIDENGQALKTTLDFVTERIASLEIELDSIESDIERFKSQNNIITETASGSLGFALSDVQSGTATLDEFEVKGQLLNSLQVILEKEENELIPTNFLGIAPTLSGYIGEYNSLIIQRKNLRQTVSELSPSVKQINRNIFDLQEVIMESVINLRKDLEIPINQTRANVQQAQKDLKLIPFVEKQLLEKLRMQTTKETLFLFLLRKKEETELSLAVASANTRVLEAAQSTGYPVFPRKRLTHLGAGLVGLLLPLVIIFLREFLNDRIESEQEIKRITDIPILGRIPHYRAKEGQLVSQDERSPRSEMFRYIRTSLNFTNHKKDNHVIAITSSMSGEGKSITAINLGLTFAWSGKKTILIDLDLRRPKVGEYLNAPEGMGLTNYITGGASLEEVVRLAPQGDLAYISSGPVPPNPSELIMSDEMKELMKALIASYDVIIIDCPPVGVVADALLMRDYVTNMIHVIRHKKATKSSVEYLEEQHQSGELVNPLLILNDINPSSAGGSYGGYHADRGKGYYLKN